MLCISSNLFLLCDDICSLYFVTITKINLRCQKNKKRKCFSKKTSGNRLGNRHCNNYVHGQQDGNTINFISIIRMFHAYLD